MEASRDSLGISFQKILFSNVFKILNAFLASQIFSFIGILKTQVFEKGEDSYLKSDP